MNPFEELSAIFHEPNRMAIMSIVAGSAKGKSFTELKQECALTDGNLSRHITALEKAGMVKVEKSFIDNRPRTLVQVSPAGRKSFMHYLDSLEEALRVANARAAGRTKKSLPALFSKPLKT